MRNYIRIVSAIALTLLPLQTWAAPKPAELNKAIHAAQPIGTAQLHELFFHVYDVSLWSDTGSWQKAPYALSITYAMDFNAEDLAARTLTEMQRVSDLPEETLRTYTDRLATLWPAVKEGDRITALARTDGSTVFFHNGKKLGAIRDAKFTSAFFGIWLSAKSSKPTMRNQLLNESGE